MEAGNIFPSQRLRNRGPDGESRGSFDDSTLVTEIEGQIRGFPRRSDCCYNPFFVTNRVILKRNTEAEQEQRFHDPITNGSILWCQIRVSTTSCNLSRVWTVGVLNERRSDMMRLKSFLDLFQAEEFGSGVIFLTVTDQSRSNTPMFPKSASCF